MTSQSEQPTGDPLLTDDGQTITVTWQGTAGRAPTVVRPDVIEGWAQQINGLRGRLDQATADCARNVQDLLEEQDARTRAVAALAEEEAELERLGFVLRTEIGDLKREVERLQRAVQAATDGWTRSAAQNLLLKHPGQEWIPPRPGLLARLVAVWRKAGRA